MSPLFANNKAHLFRITNIEGLLYTDSQVTLIQQSVFWNTFLTILLTVCLSMWSTMRPMAATDECSSDPFIVGMNVIRPCWDAVFNGSEKLLSFLAIASLTLCWRTASSTEDGFRGYIWPAQRQGVKILAWSEIVIWWWARAGPTGRDYCGLVVALDESNTVSMAHTLAVIKNGWIPVRLRNLNNYPITLGCYQEIGHLYQVDNTNIHGALDVDLTFSSDGEVEVGLVETTGEYGRNSNLDVQELVVESDLTSKQASRLTTLWVVLNFGSAKWVAGRSWPQG